MYPPFFCLTRSRIQSVLWRIVVMNHSAAQNLLRNPFFQRAKAFGEIPHPIRHGFPADLRSLAQEHLFQTVQGQMVVEL
jgi:hypothetical protein